MNIYFYCRPFDVPERAGYQHTAVGLAEGLSQLGHDIYSNTNYWQVDPDRDEYLFSYDPSVEPSDCDIEVVHSCLFDYDEPTPSSLAKSTGNRLVLLDQSDGIFNIASHDTEQNFDLVLRSHMSRHLTYPAHYEPWPFGLTSRMCEYTRGWEASNKEDRITVNFRVDHGVRKIATQETLEPLSDYFHLDTRTDDFDTDLESDYDHHFWKITGRRHYPDYYERLKKSIATAAFGGEFLPSPIFLHHPWIALLGQRLEEFLAPLRNAMNSHIYRVYQWDSFRLWEAWAAGSVPLHLDFDQYGFELPVTPSNNKHYIGFDLNKPEEGIERLVNNRDSLVEIARTGSEWVRNNYSPRAQAQRFLKLIDE